MCRQQIMRSDRRPAARTLENNHFSSSINKTPYNTMDKYRQAATGIGVGCYPMCMI